MNLIEDILSRDEFKNAPPVLLDIGASGEIRKEWHELAKYSICIAFDADKREMEYIQNEKGYKDLYVFNCIVTEKNTDLMDFYLTRSPFCSSLLEPDVESLKNWSFNDLFQVEKKISIKARRLIDIIKELKITQIDWFKTDSQGTDLRLFQSLTDDLIDKVFVADFEPGIMKAYIGEDKLSSILQYMEQKKFWLSDININGPERINFSLLDNEFGPGYKDYFKYNNSIIKNSPFWAELSFINSFDNFKDYSMRDYLLMFVFAYLKKQHGFALEIAVKGKERFNDDIFMRMINSLKTKFDENIAIVENERKKTNRHNFRLKILKMPIKILKLIRSIFIDNKNTKNC